MGMRRGRQAQAPVRIVTGKASAQKIDLEQQALTLVWPQIDGASLRVACWESSRAVEPC